MSFFGSRSLQSHYSPVPGLNERLDKKTATSKSFWLKWLSNGSYVISIQRLLFGVSVCRASQAHKWQIPLDHISINDKLMPRPKLFGQLQALLHSVCNADLAPWFTWENRVFLFCGWNSVALTGKPLFSSRASLDRDYRKVGSIFDWDFVEIRRIYQFSTSISCFKIV